MVTCSLSYLIRQPKNLFEYWKGLFFKKYRNTENLQILTILFYLKWGVPEVSVLYYCSKSYTLYFTGSTWWRTARFYFLTCQYPQRRTWTQQLLQVLHSCGVWAVLHCWAQCTGAQLLSWAVEALCSVKWGSELERCGAGFALGNITT